MARKKQKTLEQSLIEIGIAIVTTLLISHARAYAVKRTNSAFDKAKNKKDFIDYEEVKQ